MNRIDLFNNELDMIKSDDINTLILIHMNAR